MTTHFLSITSADAALVIGHGSTDSERADAIIAADAFTDGEHGDEILRPGLYPFHVDDDGNGLIGSPMCTCGHQRGVHRAGRWHAGADMPCACDSFTGWADE